MEDQILKYIMYVNGSTRGDRIEQVRLIQEAVNSGKINKNDLTPIIDSLSGIQLFDKNSTFTARDVFTNELYKEAALKLQSIFLYDEVQVIVNAFLNITSDFHTAMRAKYKGILSRSEISQLDADYIILALILVDFRVNLYQERTGY